MGCPDLCSGSFPGTGAEGAVRVLAGPHPGGLLLGPGPRAARRLPHGSLSGRQDPGRGGCGRASISGSGARSPVCSLPGSFAAAPPPGAQSLAWLPVFSIWSHGLSFTRLPPSRVPGCPRYSLTSKTTFPVLTPGLHQETDVSESAVRADGPQPALGGTAWTPVFESKLHAFHRVEDFSAFVL